MNALENPKLNPQLRYSAVAEAVALADAEGKGETINSQNVSQSHNVVRRRVQSSRPLSTVILDSIDSGSCNVRTDPQQNVPFQKRKPRPASMALIAPVEIPPQCFYCLEEASHLCNWCRSVYYCGPSHYQMHRCHSKCWPFKVKGSMTVIKTLTSPILIRDIFIKDTRKYIPKM